MVAAHGLCDRKSARTCCVSGTNGGVVSARVERAGLLRCVCVYVCELRYRIAPCVCYATRGYSITVQSGLHFRFPPQVTCAMSQHV